jgi:hypothetical protein
MQPHTAAPPLQTATQNACAKHTSTTSIPKGSASATLAKLLALQTAYTQHRHSLADQPTQKYRCAGTTVAQNPAAPPGRAVTALDNRSRAVTARHQPHTHHQQPPTRSPNCAQQVISVAPTSPKQAYAALRYAACGTHIYGMITTTHSTSPRMLQCCQPHNDRRNRAKTAMVHGNAGQAALVYEQIQSRQLHPCSSRR